LKEKYEFENCLTIKSQNFCKNIDEVKTLLEQPKVIVKPGTVYTPPLSSKELCNEGPKISDLTYSQTPYAFQCTGNVFKEIKQSVIDSLAKMNTELWIILSLLTLTGFPSMQPK
jgi:hypothetical protein